MAKKCKECTHLEEKNELLQSKNTELAEDNADLNIQISRLTRENKRLKKIAMLDELTGLRNMNFIRAEVKRIAALKERGYVMKRDTEKLKPEYVSIVFIDVDQLKHINDTFGHTIGDMVLKHIADILRKNTRKGEVAVRFHGDEFAVLFLTNDRTEGKALYERIKKKVHAISSPLKIKK